MPEYRRSAEDLDRLSADVIGAAIEVHRHVGPGLLESVYEACLAHEMRSRGMSFEAQVALPVVYKGLRVDQGLRMDMVVGGELVIEIKAVEHVLPVHHAQLMSYLKIANARLGLLINFNVPLLKDGIKRVVMNL